MIKDNNSNYNKVKKKSHKTGYYTGNVAYTSN